MLNQVILVGRLTGDPKLVTLDDGRQQTEITLQIQRNYKNAETGEYDSDNIPMILWNGIAENTVNYCRKNAVIGVKARLQASALGTITVHAEKVTFINTKRDKDDH